MAFSGGWKGPITQTILTTPGSVGRQRLNEVAQENVIKSTERTSIYHALLEKGFTSVCPDGVNVSLTRGNEVLRETPWFEKRVINQLWVQEIKKAHRWLKTVGYFVVSYEATSEIYAEVIPHVLDPRLFVLIWDINHNGVRKYFIQLRRGVTSHITHPVGGIDSKYDIFFLHHPGEDGQVVSDARACLGEIVDIDGIMRSYKIALANLVSPPFVLEQLPEKYPTEDRTPRNCGMPDTSTLTADEELGISGMKFGAIKDIKDDKRREQMNKSFSDASSRAAVTVIKHVDPNTGQILDVPHVRPWENAPVVLPEGTRLATAASADLPRDTVDILHAKIGFVCSVMGIPMEFLLGQSRNRVSTSTFAEEQLQATVKSMRKFLQDTMVQMYWRVYWQSHAEHALKCAVDVEHVMSDHEIRDMLNAVEVTFTFRSERISYEQARVLYGDGTLNGDALKRIAMERYCLKSSDMDDGDPIVGREQLLAAALAAEAAAATDGKETKSDGKVTVGKRPRLSTGPSSESASSRVDSGKDIGFEGTERGSKKRKLEGDAVAAVQ